MLKRYLMLGSWSIPAALYARIYTTPQQPEWFTAFSQFEHTIYSLMSTVSMLGGMVMLIITLFKYSKHRENPIEVTFGSVLLFLLLSIVLLLIGFVHADSFLPQR